jgi:hypothetical protein
MLSFEISTFIISGALGVDQVVKGLPGKNCAIKNQTGINLAIEGGITCLSTEYIVFSTLVRTELLWGLAVLRSELRDSQLLDRLSTG